MIKKAIDASNYVLLTKAIEEWEEKTPSYQQFAEAIQQVEDILIDMFSQYEKREVEVDLQFLLASVSPEGQSSLYLFDDRGIAQPVHHNPKFACIGSGFLLGGILLLQQFFSPDLTLEDATELAAFVINEVSKVDRSVGPFEGESCYFRLVDGEPAVGSIYKRSLQHIKREYESRKKLFRYVWKQSTRLGSSELIRIIKQATKGKKIRAQKTVKKSQG